MLSARDSRTVVNLAGCARHQQLQWAGWHQQGTASWCQLHQQSLPPHHTPTQRRSDYHEHHQLDCRARPSSTVPPASGCQRIPDAVPPGSSNDLRKRQKHIRHHRQFNGHFQVNLGWLVPDFTSHSTQNRSLWRCSSQPIYWLVLREQNQNQEKEPQKYTINPG